MIIIQCTQEQWDDLQKRLEEPARDLPRLRAMLEQAEVWREDDPLP